MKIKIFWNSDASKELFKKVVNSATDLWIMDFIQIEETTDENLKKELSITLEPALIIEEEEIDFKDVIFEWIVPEEEEIKSMFVSILWWSWCGDSSCWDWSCWDSSCSTWCCG